MIRGTARLAFPVIAALFVACAVAQVLLAGLGVFDDPAAFDTHRDFGYLFGWLTLAMLVLALAGRLPRRIVGWSALLLLLFALQSILVVVRDELPMVAALHPLNGFLILGVGVIATRESWAQRRTVPETLAAGTGDPDPQTVPREAV